MRISISKIVYTLVVLQRGFVFIFQEEKEKSKQVNQVVAQWDANKRMQQRAEKQNRRAERIRKMQEKKANMEKKSQDVPQALEAWKIKKAEEAKERAKRRRQEKEDMKKMEEEKRQKQEEASEVQLLFSLYRLTNN